MRALGFPLENLKLFNEIDTDGSQAIEFDEFLKYITMPISQNDDKKDLDQIFKLFDPDQLGFINLKNLKKIALELGENMDDHQLQDMIERADTDGDNLVT